MLATQAAPARRASSGRPAQHGADGSAKSPPALALHSPEPEALEPEPAPTLGANDSGEDATPRVLAQSPETAALVRAARAHAENSRLEQELRSLRAVARRQRGEVQWLRGIRTDLEAAAFATRQEQAILEKEAEIQRRRKLRDEEHQRMRERRERGRLAAEMLHREGELEDEQGLAEEQALRRRRVRAQEARWERARARSMRDSPGSRSPARQTKVEDSEDELAGAAAATAAELDNQRLRRELEGLRALARWQQGEVGAAMAHSVAGSDDRSTSLALSSSLPGNNSSLHLQAGIDDYDRTVHRLMSRVLGRSHDLWATPRGGVDRPEEVDSSGDASEGNAGARKRFADSALHWRR